MGRPLLSLFVESKNISFEYLKAHIELHINKFAHDCNLILILQICNLLSQSH